MFLNPTFCNCFRDHGKESGIFWRSGLCCSIQIGVLKITGDIKITRTPLQTWSICSVGPIFFWREKCLQCWMWNRTMNRTPTWTTINLSQIYSSHSVAQGLHSAFGPHISIIYNAFPCHLFLHFFFLKRDPAVATPKVQQMNARMELSGHTALSIVHLEAWLIREE